MFYSIICCPSMLEGQQMLCAKQCLLWCLYVKCESYYWILWTRCFLFFHRSFQANIHLQKDYPPSSIPSQRIWHQTSVKPNLLQLDASPPITVTGSQKILQNSEKLFSLLFLLASRGWSTYIIGDLHSRWRQVEPVEAMYHLSPPCGFNTAASTEGN